MIDRATLCLINHIRRRHGLHRLRFSRALGGVATGQAHDMVRGDYFADDSLLGQTPSARIMVALHAARSASVSMSTAQNIGWGMGSAATPAGIVRAWMHSPPHRRIMLTRAFRKAGVGVAPALPRELGRGSPGATYAMEFAAR
jgi:uncharacterized protein YkwD